MISEFDYPVHEDLTVREFLLSFHLAKPKAYILVRDGNVLLNHKPCNENMRVHEGDVITVRQDEEVDFLPMKGPLDILYEDSNFLILNKPSGLIIYPEKKDETGTFVNLVASYYQEKGYHLNVRYAHRLDKETTGLIIFCKDMLTESYMNHFIETHEIRREYRALVQGYMKDKSGTIALPIGSDRHICGKMVVSKSGKDAITHYEELYRYKGYSLVRVLLETGRTHQIRLHMSSVGNPLLGDTLYGGNDKRISRVALHSFKTEFIHPVTKEKMSITAPVPKDMERLMGGERHE